jgi:diguanylate cyclase (GGDEF)-like protein
MKLGKYIKESTNKFKKDALSKLIYDFFKWLIPFSFLFAITHWLSLDFLFFKYSVSLYWIILFSLILIIATILIIHFVYQKKYNRLKLDNFTDEVTGLKNHKALKEFLTKIIAIPASQPLSLILLDIDEFKKFNTKMGHNTADLIIKNVGNHLGRDTRTTDEIFRYQFQGDEFMIVARQTNQHQAYQAAERKRDVIANTGFEIEGNVHYLTVSCGVAEFKVGDDYDSLVNRASKALAEAKSQVGKNCTKAYV